MLRYTTDRARPALVAFYNIQPGNGAGLFLQPRNPHGAFGQVVFFHKQCRISSVQSDAKTFNYSKCSQHNFLLFDSIY